MLSGAFAGFATLRGLNASLTRPKAVSPAVAVIAILIALGALWEIVKVTFSLTDTTLPHLWQIAAAFAEESRRNGPSLGSFLADAALFTFRGALIGFIIGGVLGFALGTLFAHVPLLERSLVPFVVASQTIPILAIAPMVVVWLQGSWLSVPVIAAYLTFFPVTINTLRGMRSPDPRALELMRSYAATTWQTLWKLRFPAALPAIFTALKISATSSVVGAIIAELPAGVQQGLGGAILNFNQYYITGPERLWASIVMAALVGIGFFIIVSVAEKLALRNIVRG
jgi:NitT/TauT family transport system permease protein